MDKSLADKKAIETEMFSILRVFFPDRPFQSRLVGLSSQAALCLRFVNPPLASSIANANKLRRRQSMDRLDERIDKSGI